MLRRLILAGAVALGIAPPAAAQDAWPSRPVTIITGFPAGAGTDI